MLKKLPLKQNDFIACRPRVVKHMIEMESLNKLTCIIFIATNLNPFFSNLLMISPTRPRCTASGLSMIKVLSLLADIFRPEDVEEDFLETCF